MSLRCWCGLLLETGIVSAMVDAARALDGADAVSQVTPATARGKKAIKLSTQILQKEDLATDFIERKLTYYSVKSVAKASVCKICVDSLIAACLAAKHKRPHPVLQNPTLYPVGQRNRIEVDQQADAAFGQTQIGQQLNFVEPHQPLDRFQFKDHPVIHDDISNVTAVQQGIAVVDRQRHLTPERHLRLREFVAQAFFVHRLEQSRPKMPMHAHRQADDAIGEFAAGAVVMLHPAETAPNPVDEPLTWPWPGALGTKCAAAACALIRGVSA